MPALGKECTCESFDKLAVLVKPETVYSDDSGPTPAEAVLFTGQPTVAVQGERLQRDIAKPYWGNDKSEMVNKFVQIDGEIEVTGAGSAGNIPGAAAILRSAGMAETQESGVQVLYDPASENIPSNTVYFYRATDLWKIVGCRADISLIMAARNYARYRVRIVGLFALPEHNATLPTVPPSTDADPLVLNYANTPSATFYGQSIDLESFEFNLGNVIETNDKPGCYSVQITDRNPTATLVTCAPKLDVLNLWQKADESESGALAIQHGRDDQAGQIFGIDVPAMDLDLTQMSDTVIGTNQKGISIGMLPLPVNGDDEFRLTFK